MNEEIMVSLSSAPTAEQTRKSLNYFEDLKKSEMGWQLCMRAISEKIYSTNEHAQFFCFQVIEAYLKSRYAQDGPWNQAAIRYFVRMLPKILSSSDNSFIRNKAAQIAALVFIQDFPHAWPSFFSDFLLTLSTGAQAVNFYLRVLKAIDDEFADRDARSPVELQRNNTIRDQMRKSAIPSLVDSWFQILTSFQGVDYEIVSLCHHVVGAYIHWIDIQLIANDRFVPVLVNAMNIEMLRETAADCIYDIISKGMEPLSKVKLVESFNSYLSSVGIWQALDGSETDVDYLAKLGKIMNGMGIELIVAYGKVLKAAGSKSTESTIAITEAISSKIMPMLQILGNEDDDVSASVLDFLRDYLHLLKTKPVRTELETFHVTEIVKVVCKKIAYDTEYDFDHEGEDEIGFKEFRKQLKILIENLIAVDKDLVVNLLQGCIANAFRNWRSLPLQDTEAALFLLHILGESVPPALSQISPDSDKYSPVQKLLVIMAESEINLHTHSAVVLQYFEVAVRFEKFFLNHSEFIIQVLTTFLKTSGVFHPDKKVRSRSAYLLSRFVKGIKAQMTPELTQEMLKAVQPLLAIHDSSAQLIGEPILSDDDQLYIYEVVGLVIIAGETEQAKRSDYMNQALAPLLQTYRNIIQEIEAGVVQERAEACSQMLSQIVYVIGRLSKAFTPQNSMKSCGCSQIFINALSVFLKGISVTYGEMRMELASAVRQFFHRLIVCLDTEILELVPYVSEAFLSDPCAKNVVEYIPLLTQIISKHKKEISPFLRQIFPPLCSVILAEVEKPVEENDETTRRERIFMQKQFLQLLACILNNNLSEIFFTLPTETVNQIGAEIVTGKVFNFVVQSAIKFPDPTGQKTCFAILRKFVETWGRQLDIFMGEMSISAFLYQGVLPACFLAPSQSTFDLNDAQYMLVLSETVMCLKSLLDLRGEELICFLRRDYLPSVDMRQSDIEEYLRALQGPTKEYKEFVKALYLRTKAAIR